MLWFSIADKCLRFGPGGIVMMSFHCPHCGLPLECDDPVSSVLCPQCYQPFSPPRRRDWVLLIVPILALQYWVLYAF